MAENCWSCSRWGSATTRRLTSRWRRGPSRAGPSTNLWASYPCGFYPSRFSYRDDDHDGSEKTFLGEEGRFDGEEIIDIIVRQPATARFVARHLYNFFVADEAQVPAWDTLPPRDPEGCRDVGEGLLRFGRRHAVGNADAVEFRSSSRRRNSSG